MMYRNKQHGFLLPLITALMILFSGIWLSHQQPPSAADVTVMQAAELQHELLFWHKGVLHFQRQMGYWPMGLRTVAQHFDLAAASPRITGVVSANGFRLGVANVSSEVTKTIVMGLKSYYQYDQSGALYLLITSNSDQGTDTRLIQRDGNEPIVSDTDFDFAHFSLHAENLHGNGATFDEVRTGTISALSLTAESWVSYNLVADDVQVGPYSLSLQQQKVTFLYDSLWYCMYVSKYCFNAPKDI